MQESRGMLSRIKIGPFELQNLAYRPLAPSLTSLKHQSIWQRTSAIVPAGESFITYYVVYYTADYLLVASFAFQKQHKSDVGFDFLQIAEVGLTFMSKNTDLLSLMPCFVDSFQSSLILLFTTIGTRK